MRFTTAIDDKKLARLSKKFADHYPNEVHQIARGVSVNFQSAIASFTEGETILRRSTLDETELALIRSRSVAVSRLAPYTKWADLIKRIERDLSFVFEVKPHRQVERLGLRYINRFDIPRDDGKFKYEDYLNLYIHIPDIISSIGDHALVFQTIKNEFEVRVQSGSAEALVPGTLAFILDIDVVKNAPLPADLPDIIKLLGKMRNEKNALFEAFIKDKARELFSNVR